MIRSSNARAPPTIHKSLICEISLRGHWDPRAPRHPGTPAPLRRTHYRDIFTLPNWVVETAHYFSYYAHTGVFLKTPGYDMNIHVSISLSSHLC